jgi:hypothetical protein
MTPKKPWRNLKKNAVVAWCSAAQDCFGRAQAETAQRKSNGDFHEI